MTKHSISTTKEKILESADEPRTILFSAGEFSTAVAVYVATGETGDPDFVLCDEGTSAFLFTVPPMRSVFAWTDAGTAVLCTILIKAG